MEQLYYRNMLTTKNLSYSYGSQKIQFPDIEIEKGAQALVLGNSGKGKTTFLHLLGGLMEIQTGSIHIDGKEIKKLSKREMDRFRGDHIGIVFQSPHFIRSISMLENLKVASSLSGTKVDDKFINSLMNQLQVSSLADKLPEQLSQGEKQRFSIARALINKPLLILADEPTSALDDENCDKVFELLSQAAKEQNASLLIVTHDGRLKSLMNHQIVLN